MRIGCLQFAPQVGDVENNLNRADAVLNRVDEDDIESLDLLVLPEMSFSGYNFKSRDEITPFVEPSGSGISSLWARTTALKYDCIVAVGYPERAPKQVSGEDFYNSLVVVNGDGETVANYRKSSLYYTDETWAKEGGGFYQGEVEGLGKVAMGICMDINPYKFQTPWTAFEFGVHILTVKANLVIISMAWLTQEAAQIFTTQPEEPDMETLTYWVQRIEPIIRAEGEEEIIVVFANRCGVEGDAVYAGTSAVMGVQNGEVSVYGLLGRGSKELLIVNTEMPPFAKLVSRPEGRPDADEELSVSDFSEPAIASAAHEGVKPPDRKSPTRSRPPSRGNDSGRDHHQAQTYDRHGGLDNFPTTNRSSRREVSSARKPASPREERASGKAHSVQNGPEDYYRHSPKASREYGRTASPREGYSPKASPVFRRAASTREGYSPKFPSPREEYAPRQASPRDQYSPGLASSRDLYSPRASRRDQNSAGTPFPRDLDDPREQAIREWYNIKDRKPAGLSQTASSGRNRAPMEERAWGEEGLADLASPSFPEPTPMSMRPKLAISTGPDTLPPIQKRAPPRGVQPGNFFSSRDLCTPPETPFDDEPQPFIQQHWIPPSAFTYTPEEPEWPDATSSTSGIGQLPARRPSPPTKPDFPRGAAARTVPTRPSSRTQEVKLSDLAETGHNARLDQDVPSRRPSKSRNSSRTGALLQDRPVVANERSTPKLRSKRSDSALRSDINSHRDNHTRHPSPPKTAPIQSLPSTSFPWNSITIAASPSVFKTSFARAETFPRSEPLEQKQPQSARGWEEQQHHHRTADTGADGGDGTEEKDGEEGRVELKRSKSISALHHEDPTNYLPSPALPVHKAYQDLIYSAVEPRGDIESLWEEAARRQGVGIA